MIKVKCTCGKALQVKPQLAGKRIKCPGCSAVLQVPGAAGAASAPATPGPAPERKASRRARPAAPAPAPEPTTVACGHCRRVMPISAPNCPHCGSVSMAAVQQASVGRLRPRFDWRGRLSQLIWLGVLIALGLGGWRYGKDILSWVKVEGKWGDLATAIESEPSAGDTNVWQHMERASELGDEIGELLAEKYVNATKPVVRQRVCLVAAYVATQQGLPPELLPVLEQALTSENANERDWALKALALAAGGPEQAHACLLPFRGRRKIEVQRLKPDKRAQQIILAREPAGVSPLEDATLAAAKVLAGDTQALSAFGEFLQLEPKYVGRAKDLLTRLTGRRFRSAEDFKAWWEGPEGAYQKQRGGWLVDAFDAESEDQHLAIVTQLRALSGQSYEYNRAAPEQERERVIMSWKAWWAREQGSY